MLLRICRRTAITAQQFCSIQVASNLLVSDGISKTVVWKNQDAPMSGTSQIQERSSYRHAGVDLRAEGFIQLSFQTGDERCASRRSPR
jgi:hypothetical protein